MCRGPRGQASLKGSSGPICGRAELPAMMSIPIHGFIGHVSVLLFPFPASLLAHKRSPFYLCDMEFSLVMVPCNRNRFFGTVRFPKEASFLRLADLAISRARALFSSTPRCSLWRQYMYCPPVLAGSVSQ